MPKRIGKMRYLFLLLLTAFLDQTVRAESFCENESLVIDLQTEWDLSQRLEEDLVLPTIRGGELVPSRSHLHLETTNIGGDLGGFYEFPRLPNEVALPYNLYRLQIQIGSEENGIQLIDQDYTSGCSGPGIALWAGSRLELRPIKIEPNADGSPRKRTNVHLRFWGK